MINSNKTSVRAIRRRVATMSATTLALTGIGFTTPAQAAGCVTTQTNLGGGVYAESITAVGGCDWTVPTGATSLEVLLVGAGGSALNGYAGSGGEVKVVSLTDTATAIAVQVGDATAKSGDVGRDTVITHGATVETATGGSDVQGYTGGLGASSFAGSALSGPAGLTGNLTGGIGETVTALPSVTSSSLFYGDTRCFGGGGSAGEYFYPDASAESLTVTVGDQTLCGGAGWITDTNTSSPFLEPAPVLHAPAANSGGGAGGIFVPGNLVGTDYTPLMSTFNGTGADGYVEFRYTLTTFAGPITGCGLTTQWTTGSSTAFSGTIPDSNSDSTTVSVTATAGGVNSGDIIATSWSTLPQSDTAYTQGFSGTGGVAVFGSPTGVTVTVTFSKPVTDPVLMLGFVYNPGAIVFPSKGASLLDANPSANATVTGGETVTLTGGTNTDVDGWSILVSGTYDSSTALTFVYFDYSSYPSSGGTGVMGIAKTNPNGCGVPASPSETTLTRSPDASSVYGDLETFTATVGLPSLERPTPGAPTPRPPSSGPNGVMTFYDSATVLDTCTVVAIDASTGSCSITRNNLHVGTHPLTAFYAGDATLESSTSTTLNHAVTKAPLQVTPNNRTVSSGSAAPSASFYTYSVTGWKLGEDSATALSYVAPTCGSNYTSSDLPGTQTISCGGNPNGTAGSASDYSFSYDTATLTVQAVSVTLNYLGPSAVYTPDTSTLVSLTANYAPSAPNCTISFTLVDANSVSYGPYTATTVANGNASTAAIRLPLGVYQVTVSVTGGCTGAADTSGTLSILPGTLGIGTIGGGWYKVTAVNPPKVGFGYNVQQTSQVTDAKTKAVTTTWKGQMVWVSKNGWRIKSAWSNQLTRYTNGTTTGITGWVTGTCPSGPAYPSGSTPKCGTFRGTGVLETWDSTLNGGAGGWKSAYSLVKFAVTVYDGGSMSTCKTIGKTKTCTSSDLTDYFGIQITKIDDTAISGPPSTVPIALSGGSLKAA